MIAKLDCYFFICLMFLSLVYPGGLSQIKMLLFAMYLSIRFLNVMNSDRTYPFFAGVIIPVLFAFVGIAYCLYGLIQDAPGAIKVLSVYFAYPIILGLLASTVSKYEAEKIFDILYILSLVVALIGFFAIILTFNGFDLTLLYPGSAASIGYIPGYTKFSFQLIDSLTFILPFTLSYVILTSERRSNLLNVIIIGILIFIAIASGRRALWIILIIPLIILFVFGRIGASKTIGFIFISIVSLVSVFYIVDLDLEQLSFVLKTGFDFKSSSVDVGGIARGEQLDALTRGFWDKPLFGHGLGSTAASYGSVRSEETYQYELTYNYHLFATGIFGFGIYASGIFYILYKLYIISINDANGFRAFSLFVGLAGFLFGIASNPWLSKFDFMYVVFIPYAYIIGKRRD